MDDDVQQLLNLGLKMVVFSLAHKVRQVSGGKGLRQGQGRERPAFEHPDGTNKTPFRTALAIWKGDVNRVQSFTVILRGFTRSDLGKVRVSTP